MSSLLSARRAHEGATGTPRRCQQATHGSSPASRADASWLLPDASSRIIEPADPSPEVLRGLFHAAWFVQWTGRLDARSPGPVTEPHHTEDADEVFRAIVERDPVKAEALVTGYEGPRAPLEQALARGAAEDHSVAPIMVVHTVKTAQASIVESRALGSDSAGARAPMSAAARFLASPKRERFVYQATLEAVAFIDGRSKGETEEGSAA